MIKILGAGISGLTASINLAKAGHDVEIFELRNNSGARFRGDLQGLENWSSKKDVLKDLKSMNLKLNFKYKSFNKIFFSEGSEMNGFISKKPFFYLVKRGVYQDSIDQGLKKQAIKLGVKIHFNSKINERDISIVATGPKKVTGFTKGISFETNTEDMAVMLLNNKAAYNGYSYLLVKDGYGCICTVTSGRDIAQSCLEVAKKIFKNLVDLNIKNQNTVGGYGYFNCSPTLVKNNKLYIGEAAGLQDFLFGFGMRYAITSGYLAAKSLIYGADYKKSIEERFSKQLKSSVVNRFLFEKLIKHNKIFVNRIKKIENPLDMMTKVYNFSFRSQRILFPIALMAIKKKYNFD